jgi:hypothetical protein
MPAPSRADEGAELTLSMVDLQFDQKSRFYQAPPQVKANNGLFIVDDLGRQLVSPQDLMNRWIVPLDRHVDYFALHTGKKFEVSFDVIVVFSSNLQPSKLADEAFLRRLGYKIFVGPLPEADYRRIFTQVCEQNGIAFVEDGVSLCAGRTPRRKEAAARYVTRATSSARCEISHASMAYRRSCHGNCLTGRGQLLRPRLVNRRKEV